MEQEPKACGIGQDEVELKGGRGACVHAWGRPVGACGRDGRRD